MRRFVAAFVLSLVALPALAADVVSVAITTSIRDSGLFDALSPAFTAKTAIPLRVVAAGTGQAIRLARTGDVDVLFVHHKPSEEKFVADGFGVERHDVMANTFVLIGPADDPANVKKTGDIAQAFLAIAQKKAPFLSRGDQSGTHKKERALWASPPSGSWHRESGQGQGATLNMAVAMGAYVLSDKGTWLAFRNKADLRVLVEGGANASNPYGATLVSKEKQPHVNAVGGQAFIDWLTGPDGQAIIDKFHINGQPLFRPTATPR